jgi:predicted acetyltransferase
MQKAIRKTDKKFIAVTCHFDVQDWLIPDWIFNTDTMSFQSFEGQKKNRPKIKFEIYQTQHKSIWKMFAKHHYLSHSHNNSANVFLALINEEIAGFLSVLHFPHPKVKNMKKVHRLVILPDYQGAGFGIKFLNEIANIYKKQKNRFVIVTSSPSLIFNLKKSDRWNCIRFGRVSETKNGVLKGTTSKNRLTASFELN